MDKVTNKCTTSGHGASLLGSGLKHLRAGSKQSSAMLTLSCFHTLIPSQASFEVSLQAALVYGEAGHVQTHLKS